MSNSSENVSVYSSTEDLISTDSPIGLVRQPDRLGSSKKKARFDDEQVASEQEYHDDDKSYDDDFESDHEDRDGDDNDDNNHSVHSRDSGPQTVTHSDHLMHDGRQESVYDNNNRNIEERDHDKSERVSVRSHHSHDVGHIQPDEPEVDEYVADVESDEHESSSGSIRDALQKEDSNSPDSDIHTESKGRKSTDNVNPFIYRDNTNTSLLSRRRERHRNSSSGNSWSPPRRDVGGRDIRHYTTMKSKDNDGHIKYDNISLKSNTSRGSGLFNNFLNLMSSSFIYETDPFDGALRWCPKVTYSVVERATMPIAIESPFGNPQKQTLPSYYYTSTDRNSARPKRGGSRLSRSSSAQSVSVGEKSLPSLDSPRNSPHDPFRHEIDAFIPEEEEDTVRKPRKRGNRSGSSNKEGPLPNIMVSDHSLSKGQRGSAKRPVTSSSTKTTKSLGLPGKPMKS